MSGSRRPAREGAGLPELLRVLILEESPSEVVLLVQHLSHAGLAVQHQRVDTAAGMREALQEQAWDLILCGHPMPGFSVAEALQIFRDMRVATAFVVVSAEDSDDTGAAVILAGAHDYVGKSNLARLVPVVAREVREARERRERHRAERALRRTEEDGTTEYLGFLSLRDRIEKATAVRRDA